MRYDYRLKFYLKNKYGTRFDLVFAFFNTLRAAERVARKFRKAGFQGHDVEGFSITYLQGTTTGR